MPSRQNGATGQRLLRRMFRFGDWINRKRHNRGFGIQSPSAFFFITQVLREKLPYYAYDSLDTIACNCREMSCRRCRMLFRIVNHFAPASSIVVASATAACAIGSARRSIPKLLITAGDIPHMAAGHLKECGCSHVSGDIIRQFHKGLTEYGGCGLLYLGECDDRSQLLETALAYTNKESIIIVEGIHRNREWWRQVVSDPRTIVTYDMYSTGILLFDNERYKQNYTLKR